MLVAAYGLSPDSAGRLPQRQADGARPASCSSPSRPTGSSGSRPCASPRPAPAGPGRTHVYEFAWPSPQFDGRLGACHALEIPFVFDTLDAPGSEAMGGTDAPQELADVVHRAWVDFVTTGDPGWPVYDLDARPVQVFGTLTAVTPDPRGAQRRLWEGVRV